MTTPTPATPASKPASKPAATTKSGRPSKLVTPGEAPEPLVVDEAKYDPTSVPDGVPIARPDPDEPYPQHSVLVPAPLGKDAKAESK